MKFKRIAVLFSLMLVLSTFFSSFAFAENNVKPNLVSLGDSITYGWNLEGPDNSHQSLKAFPYLIGNGNYTVGKNISGGGWTSKNLLDEINKPENLEAIKNADVITLDIGSNDFLQNPAIRALFANPSAPIDPVQFGQVIQQISDQLFVNLTSIVGVIKSQNQDAQIIIYDIYNPFTDVLAPLYPIGEQFLPQVNAGIKAFADQAHLLCVSAYTAFKGHQAEYIFPKGDVHPNESGQQVLASLSTEILKTQVPSPITVTLSPSTTETTKEPVTVTVSTSAKKVLALEWLEGTKDVADFAAAGNPISDLKFEVTKNGTYTVYVRDSKGAKAVSTITISNITSEVQNPTPTPTPVDTGNSSNTDSGTNTNSGQTPTTSVTTTTTGNQLPSTASSMFTYMMVGLVLLLAGAGAMQVQHKRRSMR